MATKDDGYEIIMHDDIVECHIPDSAFINNPKLLKLKAKKPSCFPQPLLQHEDLLNGNFCLVRETHMDSKGDGNDNDNGINLQGTNVRHLSPMGLCQCTHHAPITTRGHVCQTTHHGQPTCEIMKDLDGKRAKTEHCNTGEGTSHASTDGSACNTTWISKCVSEDSTRECYCDCETDHENAVQKHKEYDVFEEPVRWLEPVCIRIETGSTHGSDSSHFLDDSDSDSDSESASCELILCDTSQEEVCRFVQQNQGK